MYKVRFNSNTHQPYKHNLYCSTFVKGNAVYCSISETLRKSCPYKVKMNSVFIFSKCASTSESSRDIVSIDINR